MPCEYCLHYGEHDKNCPNYSPIKTGYICSVCEKDIEPNQEYIENNDGDKAHWDCVNTTYELAGFLDCEIKEMEDRYDRYEEF